MLVLVLFYDNGELKLDLDLVALVVLAESAKPLIYAINAHNRRSLGVLESFCL